MPMDAATIARLEKELEEARTELLLEDGKRYQVIMREMPEQEKERILDGLTNRQERILFGLEAPPRRGSQRSGKSGGTLECPICHKQGLTELGLKLHHARIHKEEKTDEPSAT